MPVVQTAIFRTRLLVDPENFLRNNIVVYDPPALTSQTALLPYQVRVSSVVTEKQNPETVEGALVYSVIEKPSKGLMSLFLKKDDDRYWQETNGSYFSIEVDQAINPPNGAMRDDFAYLLPWAWRDEAKIYVRTDAGLFFNACMSGCTFGWRVERDHSMTLIHSNYVDRDKTQAERDATGSAAWTEREIADRMKSSLDGIRVFSPSDYRSSHQVARCSIIGLFNGARWSLYQQTYTKDMFPGDGTDVTYRYRIWNASRLA